MALELEDIVCFEAGSDEEPWSGSPMKLGRDSDALQRLERAGVLSIDENGDAIRVSGTDQVGLIMLPSGRRLVIRSKISSLMVLEWLAYLGEFPPLQAWLPDAGVTTGDDLHTCIGRLFLYELEKVTRLYLRKDYVPKIVDTATIQGRLLTSRLSNRFHRLPRAPQRVRSRTYDTCCNIVLALALDRLPALLCDAAPADRTLLGELREAWARVQRGITDPITAVTEFQWAAPSGYHGALQLARLLLIGAALDPDRNVGGQAFTLSLARIWERSLRRMFHSLRQRTGWSCVPDAQRTRQWDDYAGQNDPVRWVTADVLAVRENQRWVLDAKYKRAFGNESREDRFQMCAYAVSFDAGRVTLVYPTAVEQPRQRTLLETTIAGRRLTIDSIALPMQAGPAACRRALAHVCD